MVKPLRIPSFFNASNVANAITPKASVNINIMCPVSTIQQIPGYFTDYGKAQQSKEIPVPAPCMNKSFRYQ